MPTSSATLPHILIVDDEASMPSSIVVALNNRANCVVFSNAFEALSHIQRTGTVFCGAFIDQNMPGMIGTDLITELTQRDSALACVLITGDPKFESAVAAANVHVFKYLVKPSNLAELRDTAAKAVTQTKSARAQIEVTFQLANAQRAAAEARSLSEVLQLKHKAVASLIHDIHHPLSQLVQISEELSKGLNAEGLDHAEMVRHSYAVAKHLEMLTELDKFGTGRRSTLSSATEVLRRLLQLKVRETSTGRGGIEIVVGHVNAQIMLHMRVDDVVRVLLNLGANAIEACANSPAGKGGVVITSSVVQGPSLAELRAAGFFVPSDFGDLASDAMFAQVDVVDYGIGIPPTNLAKIFSHGYTTKAKGNGLGVSGALQLMKTNDGLIAVSSDPSSGTTFRLFFPCESLEA